MLTTLVRRAFQRTGVRGFTLIELLIVIAIILILIAIALPNFLEAQVRARVTQANGNLRSIEQAMMQHQLDWGCVPADFNDSGEITIRCRWHGPPLGAPCSGGARFPPRDSYKYFLAGDSFYALNIHCPLTTPIRYLGPDAVKDPFGNGIVPVGYDSREVQTANGRGNKIIYAAFWSAGPDRIAGHWARGWGDGMNGTRALDTDGDGCPEATPYSPTNGSGSIGELWGVVGDWQHILNPRELPCGSARREYRIQRTY